LHLVKYATSPPIYRRKCFFLFITSVPEI
jgi:hypothetical protein